MILKNVLLYLTDRPTIGISAGFGSGLLLTVQTIVMDEKVLKVVAGFGVWFGMLVAGLTLVLKTIEIAEKLKTKFKRNHEKSNNTKEN